jgi:hypothetical protein
MAEVKHFLAVLETQDEYDKYQRFAAEECLLQSGGVICPQPGIHVHRVQRRLFWQILSFLSFWQI